MGLRIELENLWRRLITRFKARRKTDTDLEDPDYPVLLETVQPITNFDELAKDTKAYQDATASILAGATTWTELFTVPAGKRWKLLSIAANRSSGDNTIDQFQFWDKSEAEDCPFVKFTAVATTVQSTFNPFHLEEGDEIQVHPSGAGVAASVFAGWIIVEEENAY